MLSVRVATALPVVGQCGETTTQTSLAPPPPGNVTVPSMPPVAALAAGADVSNATPAASATPKVRTIVPPFTPAQRVRRPQVMLAADLRRTGVPTRDNSARTGVPPAPAAPTLVRTSASERRVAVLTSEQEQGQCRM